MMCEMVTTPCLLLTAKSALRSKLRLKLGLRKPSRNKAIYCAITEFDEDLGVKFDQNLDIGKGFRNLV